MGQLEAEALRRAMKDFRELHPGVRYDRNNQGHVAFIDRQIKAHIYLFERNRLHHKFGNQWETPR